MMLVSSSGAYFLNNLIAKARYGNADNMNFETPLTSLVWYTSIISIGFDVSRFLFMIPGAWRQFLTLVEAFIHYLLRHACGCHHPRIGESIYFGQFSACEGSGFFFARRWFIAQYPFWAWLLEISRAYWIGLSMVILMAVGYFVSMHGLGMTLHGPISSHACTRCICIRTHRIWLPRHGTGNDRC